MQNISSIEKILDICIKFFGVASRIGIVIGGLAFLIYCHKINYFPESVSAGDTLALIFISVAFAVLYLSFSISLYALGVTLYPVWKTKNWVLNNLCVRILSKNIKNIKYVKPGLLLATLSLLGLIIIFFAGLAEPLTVLTLLLCCWILAAMAATYTEVSVKVSSIESEISSPFNQLNENQKQEHEKAKRYFKKTQYQIAGFSLIVPLLVGGMSGKLLDGSLNVLNIKSDNVILHIKKPYSDLIETYGFKPLDKSIGVEFKAFDNAAVLLRGIGKNTVIAPFPDKPKINVAIPNESVVIQKVNKSLDR